MRSVLHLLVCLAIGDLCQASAADLTPAQEPNESAPITQTPTPATPPGAADDSNASAICTDRPTKSNFACTVDAGHFQYETDVLNTSVLRTGGNTTDTLLPLNPTVKYGLDSVLDVEANLAPLEVVRTSSRTTPAHTTTGVGDLILRLKYEFFKSPGDDVQIALLPYWKVPTARVGIGDGREEGGLLLPINIKLSSSLTLTTVPEVDAYADPTGQGYHVNTSQLVNLGLSLPGNLTWYTELWSDWNFAPGERQHQATADTALSYGINSNLQIDVGMNYGFTGDAPRIQAYLGLAQKL